MRRAKQVHNAIIPKSHRHRGWRLAHVSQHLSTSPLLPARRAITLNTHDHRFITRLPHGERVPLDVLRQWTESGSVEAALKTMAKQEEFPHWGSKGAINRAGEALRGGKLERGHA